MIKFEDHSILVKPILPEFKEMIDIAKEFGELDLGQKDQTKKQWPSMQVNKNSLWSEISKYFLDNSNSKFNFFLEKIKKVASE